MFFFIGFDWFYSFRFHIIMAGAYIPDDGKIYNIIWWIAIEQN